MNLASPCHNASLELLRQQRLLACCLSRRNCGIRCGTDAAGCTFYCTLFSLNVRTRLSSYASIQRCTCGRCRRFVAGVLKTRSVHDNTFLRSSKRAISFHMFKKTRNFYVFCGRITFTSFPWRRSESCDSAPVWIWPLEYIYSTHNLPPDEVPCCKQADCFWLCTFFVEPKSSGMLCLPVIKFWPTTKYLKC